MGSKLDKESAIIQRVKEIISGSNLSVTRFAESIEMKQTTLNQQLMVGKLSAATLENILKTYPEVSAEWLMRGVGSMYDNACEQDFACMQNELDAAHRQIEKLQSQVDLLNKVLEKLVK